MNSRSTNYKTVRAVYKLDEVEPEPTINVPYEDTIFHENFEDQKKKNDTKRKNEESKKRDEESRKQQKRMQDQINRRRIEEENKKKKEKQEEELKKKEQEMIKNKEKQEEDLRKKKEEEELKKNKVKENFNNTDPSVWGPKFWFTLHNGALYYPSLANPLFIERMKNFILGIPVMLPCIKCREHATAYIESKKDQLDLICRGKDSLFKFFVDFHNQVNVRNNKPEMSYEDAYKLYDQ